MMVNRGFVVLAFLLAVGLFASGGAHAKIEKLESFTDWQVYKQDTGKERVCYISSVPKNLRGKYERANRGETRVFVSHGPGKGERNVVSVVAGYSYKKQSDVAFEIDKKSSKLFTLDDHAWANGPNDDQRIIQAMKRGSKLTVTGTSSRGNKTIDDYSLSGFTKAKAFMDKACP